MYKLWCLIIYGYVPKWNIIEEKSISNQKGDHYIGKYYVLQCEQTGKISHKTIYVGIPS